MKPDHIVRWILLGGCVVSTIGCDQATKHIARTHLVGPPISLLGGSVRIALAQNDGGFLSLGASLPDGLRTAVFLLGVACALVVAAVYLIRSTQLSLPALLCAWLIWAGGVSNLLDRVLFDGRVTDFMMVGCGPLRTGVFNVADVAIVAGGVLLALFTLGPWDFARVARSQEPQ